MTSTLTITTAIINTTAIEPAEPTERLGATEVPRREIAKILRLTGIPALRQLAWHLKRHPSISLRDLCDRRGVHIAVVTQAFIDHQRNTTLKYLKKHTPPRRGGRRPALHLSVGGRDYTIRQGNLPPAPDPLTQAVRQHARRLNINSNSSNDHRETQDS